MFIELAVFGLVVVASLVTIKRFGIRFRLVYAVRLLAFAVSLGLMIQTSFVWILPAVGGLTVLVRKVKRREDIDENQNSLNEF